MATDTATATRRWRLCAWDAEKNLTHDSVVTGDRALDTELARLERDPDVVRTTVAAY